MIQSFVDLITNSSTSVFQYAGNPDKLKGIIDVILKISGSELTSDDLFKINIDESQAQEAYLYYIGDYASDDINRLEKAIGTTKFEEIVLEICERDNDTYMSFSEWKEKNYKDDTYSTFFKIIPLDPKWENEINLLKEINHLFEYDAVYC